jgi:P pilus assembly chaperone PapD
MNHFGDMLSGKTYTSDDSDGEKEEDKKSMVYYSFLNHKNNKDKFNDDQFTIEPRDKRMFRAKAVANQEKDIARTLTLNIQRRDTRLTVVNTKAKNYNFQLKCQKLET